MNREQITEGLKMLRSYEVAVKQFEENRIGEITNNNPLVASGCRVTLYSDIPTGNGLGSRQPSLTGLWTFEDMMEYQKCLYMSRWLRAALSALNEDEHKVVTLKWMDGLTLNTISQRIHMSERTVKTLHGTGLRKMETCLRFVEFKQLQTVA